MIKEQHDALMIEIESLRRNIAQQDLELSKDSGRIEIMRLHKDAIVPERATELAVGFDVASTEAAVVPAGSKALIKTGWAISIPTGTYARIAPRSGLARKNMINIGAGVVDAGYRGEIGAVILNHSKEDFQVERGDRIAQLILERVSMAKLREVQKLEGTRRGTTGFGSTGTATPSEIATFEFKFKSLPMVDLEDEVDDGYETSDSEKSCAGLGMAPCEPLGEDAKESVRPLRLQPFYCGPVSVPGPSENTPATGFLLSAFEIVKMWIADTGCGRDMVSKRQTAAFRQWLVVLTQ